ncbi:mitochondrial ribosomal protein l51 / s25 / CI-B8 domain-containing protein [Sarocladium implicatum]|nr:mitochondrial ribosomal protein l51 / s25 / CI-B8 domain-containing protein [Sarocladium implicatum]
MVRAVGNRVNQLRKLINLKCGPGAAILPPEVTRIHMDFALRMGGGHMGPRKFMKEQLPRLKYHNPSIPMIVNRHNVNSRSPLMTIYFRKPDSPQPSQPPPQPTSSLTDFSKAQPPAEHERVVTIDMKDKHSSHILDYFIAETRATPVAPSAEDLEEMKSLERLRQQGEIDREKILRDKKELEKERELLRRAREMAGMSED